MKFSEAIDRLNKQAFAGMCSWMADCSRPHICWSYLEVPIDINVTDIQDKTDDELVEFVQSQIAKVLREQLSDRILRKLICGGE